MSDHICFVQRLETPEVSFHLNDFTVLFWLLRIVSLRMQHNNSYFQYSRISLKLHLPGFPAASLECAAEKVFRQELLRPHRVMGAEEKWQIQADSWAS